GQRGAFPVPRRAGGPAGARRCTSSGAHGRRRRIRRPWTQRVSRADDCRTGERSGRRGRWRRSTPTEIPGLAEALPLTVQQLDASRYRAPDAVGPGAVLIVGSGQSGVQIAEELGAAGRDVLLATSRVARAPRRYRGRDVHEWSVELGVYDQPTEQVSDRRQLREAHPMLSGARGGHTIALQQLARDGVRLLGRLTEVDDTKLRF